MALSIQTEADQVIFEEILGARKVILNRTKKLNSLNYEMLSKMHENDPIGLKIFLRTIREGRSKNIKQCLETEYIAISNLTSKKISHDLYEGSRAMLIENDKKPQWLPTKLEDASDDMVAKFFSVTFSEEDDWIPLQPPSRSNEAGSIASKL